ncbi:MAG: TolC family protein [Phycisphaerales bacterium]|nr:TolC family protein [Phycisphaerales bacterium]
MKSKRFVSILVICLNAQGWFAAQASLAAMAQVERLDRLDRRPDDVDPVLWHTADPVTAIPRIEKELDSLTNQADRRFAENLVERLRSIKLTEQVNLSLQDALHRALLNNHAVRIQSYAPAIGIAGIVEAEAVFDAVFFMNGTRTIRDVPTATQLAGSKVDAFSIAGGIRKLLPTGMQVSAQWDVNRTSTDNQFQTVNPVYESAFTTQFTQPLLRNAGLDFNRSRIEIARNDRRIGEQQFRRELRQTLFNVEQAYWQLVASRREVTIRARLLSEFEKIYDYLWQRRDFDTYQIQLSQTKAELETSKATFIRIVNNVRDAEDRLIALMNDPALDLANDMEIIPEDFPTSSLVDYDPIAEVQAALDNRSEIAEARMRVENARVQVGAAKNQALPRLDLNFTYTVDGLGTNADDAFDQVTQSDFMEYLTTLNFEVPIGNRAARAAERRARLVHAQSIAGMKAQIEGVILEVNLAVRGIETAYQLIEPTLASANANEDQVASVIARAERKDFSALNQELGARNALAASRSALIDALVRYTLAIAELERSKDTLLQYNNIKLVSTEP